MGYRSKKGGLLSKGTVGYWFQNPYPYAGCYVWNVCKKGKIQAEKTGSSWKTSTKPSSAWKKPRVVANNTINGLKMALEIVAPLTLVVDCFIVIYVVISFSSKAARSTTTCITSVVLTTDGMMLVRISCT